MNQAQTKNSISNNETFSGFRSCENGIANQETLRKVQNDTISEDSGLCHSVSIQEESRSCETTGSMFRYDCELFLCKNYNEVEHSEKIQSNVDVDDDVENEDDETGMKTPVNSKETSERILSEVMKTPLREAKYACYTEHRMLTNPFCKRVRNNGVYKA